MVVPAVRRRGLRWISGGRREGGFLFSDLGSLVGVRVLGWAGSLCIFAGEGGTKVSFGGVVEVLLPKFVAGNADHKLGPLNLLLLM